MAALTSAQHQIQRQRTGVSAPHLFSVSLGSIRQFSSCFRQQAPGVAVLFVFVAIFFQSRDWVDGDGGFQSGFRMTIAGMRYQALTGIT